MFVILLGVIDVNGTPFLCVTDIMKSKSNPDFMKKQSKLARGVRSKVSAVCFSHQHSVSHTVSSVYFRFLCDVMFLAFVTLLLL